jgi:hypothetical protein
MPTKMDDKVISQIFEDSFLKTKTPVFYNSAPEEEKLAEEKVYTE